MSQETNVNLENIDWNNFSIEAFQDLHKQFTVEKPKRKKRSENNQKSVINLGNKKYEIPTKELLRYKALKNDKAKSKFRSQIIENYSPIGEI